jgi:hypothetical protein
MNELKVKAKVTLLCIMKVHREGRGIVLPIYNLCTRKGLVVSAMPQPLYRREGDPVPIVAKAGWVLGLVW